MAKRKTQANREQFTGYETGYDMWRDYKISYGVIAAYCICKRYLDMQAHSENTEEQEYCRQLQEAMDLERSMNDVPVYNHSEKYAELDGCTEQYSESDRINRLCAGDIDEAIDACSYGDGSVDYKDALNALTVRYGIERLRFVLACEVRWDSAFGRYPDEHYQWARKMKINENFGRYGVRTRPEFLAELITELRQSERRKIELKSKMDFYVAFYEQLAMNGFQAYRPSYDYDKKHIADICVNGYNIAHLTKEDLIEPNPYAEGIEPGTIEQIRNIARNAAMMFRICTEKPYDEARNERLGDGSYKLAEVDGTVLSCAHHPILGYVFSVQGQNYERQNFYNKSDAKRGFAIACGLVDEKQFFTEKGLTAIYDNLMKQLMMPDNGLDSQAAQESEYILAKIEDLMPSLGGCDISDNFEAQYEVEHSEGVEQ